METIWSTVSEWGEAYGMKVLAALAIFVIGRIVIGILAFTLSRLMRRSNADETLARFVNRLVRMGLLVVLVIAVLDQLGVQTMPFVAVLGAAGLAVGFALQGSLANFAAGVLLIVYRPFKTSDYVEIGGASGTVEEISIFNTVLRTSDNRVIVVPNGSIISGNIVNNSVKSTRRIDMVFGIGYDDDLRKAKEILLGLLKQDDRILDDPAPLVRVSELADSSVNFVVRPWVKSSDYWEVYWDLTEKVKLTFEAEGISIPFPQHDVHLHREDAA